MASGTDDDALTWDGDDDPTLVAPKKTAAEPVVLPDGFTPLGKGSDAVSTEAEAQARAEAEAAAVAEAPVMGNAMLITVGVFAGIYALFTVGWVIGGMRLQGYAQFLVAPVGYQVSMWLAVAAPALWFAAVWLLTRASASWVRIVWLVAGLALLVPWPFIMVGVVGR